jgi:dTDP-4-amino-4,6-dideoxygalactose transaminase
MEKIEFFRHNISEKDIENVNRVLNTIFLSTGDTVGEFEDKFARYLGCEYAVGVNSCTAALHLSLLAYGIGLGDEVITSPMTFISTANVIIQAGARPVFVDVEAETANIDAALIEKAVTRKTKAILPVHLYGQMCDMKQIKNIADKHKLTIIEDAAHTIEAKRDGIKPGQLGDTACFSFYATKSITSGEGGAISVHDKETAEKLKQLRNHGMSKGASERYSKRYEHWDMEVLGWKYNMYNIQAALLLNQLENIDSFWRRRDEICRRYESAFHGLPGITCLKIMPDSKSGRLMFTILVSPEKRDGILWQLQEKGIGVAVNFRAIHLLTYYRSKYSYKRGMFPVAERIGDSTISLPVYPRLTDEEIERVIDTVKEVVAGKT